MPDRDEERILVKHDDERRKEMAGLIARGSVRTGRGWYAAAMVFQHGKTLADFRRAMVYARKSMKLGYGPARWLAAAAEDRYLMKLGKKQKYGTQFRQKKSGIWILHPVLSSTSDEDRKRFDVPSLAESMRYVNTLNQSRKR